MTYEIERKFLVDIQEIQKLDTKPDNLINIQSIEQTYLSFDPEVRIRKINYLFTEYKSKMDGRNFYYLTVKSDGNMVRKEFEIEISQGTYEELLSKANSKTIIKQRYEIELEDGLIAEIDKYKDFDFNTIEIEFENEEQAYDFVISEWFGVEVTKDSRYKNKNLAKMMQYESI